MKLFLLILYQVSIFENIHGAGRVGQICSNHGDCGPNEVCKITQNVIHPCRLGRCSCDKCHDLNSNDDCVPIIQLKLGDVCDALNANLKYPQNAICSPANYVTCQWGWMEFGNACIRNASATYGAMCRWSSDCSADMWCNEAGQCSCYYAYDKYDKITEVCVKKDYQDTCQTNNECRVYGQNWNGFTFSTGECRDGRCECSSNGKLAVTGYVDDKTGQFRTKPICVIAGAKVNASVGDRCTTDPLYYGDTPTTSVCGPESFCFQCPEDVQMPGFGSFDGRCRLLARPEPPQTCPGDEVVPPTISSNSKVNFPSESQEIPGTTLVSDYITEIGPTSFPGTAGSQSSATTYEYELPVDETVHDSATVALSASLEEILVANGTFYQPKPVRRCQQNADCHLNERCIASAQCGRGVCVCSPPYQENFNGTCVATYLPQGFNMSSFATQDSALEDEYNEDIFYDEHGQVPARFLKKLNKQEIEDGGSKLELSADFMGNASYMMPCSSNDDCWNLRGTVCQQQPGHNTTTCSCLGKMFWYQNKTCKFVDYGDPCQSDEDCNTGLYAVNQGHTCRQGKCACSQGHTPFTASILRAQWGLKLPPWSRLEMMAKAATYCLPNNQPVRIARINESCTIEVLNKRHMNEDQGQLFPAPVNRNEILTICSPGLTCLYCAGDDDTGQCTEFMKPEPVQQSTTVTLASKSTTKPTTTTTTSTTTKTSRTTTRRSTTFSTSASSLKTSSKSVTLVTKDEIRFEKSSSSSSSTLSSSTSTSSIIITSTGIPVMAKKVNSNNNQEFDPDQPPIARQTNAAASRHQRITHLNNQNCFYYHHCFVAVFISFYYSATKLLSCLSP